MEGSCLCVGNLSPAMGARNQVSIGLSYRPASRCSLATQFQTRFLESIPLPILGLQFSTLGSVQAPLLPLHPPVWKASEIIYRFSPLNLPLIKIPQHDLIVLTFKSSRRIWGYENVKDHVCTCTITSCVSAFQMYICLSQFKLFLYLHCLTLVRMALWAPRCRMA